MSCSTCGGSHYDKTPVYSDCGSTDCKIYVKENWQLPVKELPPVEFASRKFIYILPTDQAFMLNYSADSWLEMTNFVMTKEAIEEIVANKLKELSENDKLLSRKDTE